ncbi:hypothetical protein IGI04_026002 [Brassica rapa subsp. trilocularis]|uniref:Uncharacterized protein n=1 Tax=Brassica rapa subsp. trilocularis TaxID=1813537 RepID=A0ABQ7KXG5_BRACM|nr:hypothetical protein IGI04_026002 [Brassica rapa subsp. trilocularis]
MTEIKQDGKQARWENSVGKTQEKRITEPNEQSNSPIRRVEPNTTSNSPIRRVGLDLMPFTGPRRISPSFRIDWSYRWNFTIRTAKTRFPE